MKSLFTIFTIIEIIIFLKIAIDLYIFILRNGGQKMNIKNWNKLNTTNKRIFMLLSKELYELSKLTNSKYEVVIINGEKL